MDKAVILIIDDDPSLRKTLADILKIKGYRTLAAGDGAEGLSFMQSNAIDLALIDLGLPDIPGLDLLSKIKADHPATAAIILTGNATLASAMEATNRGAFSYLTKPYDIEQLMLLIRRALEKRQVDTALRQSEIKFRGLLESAPDGMLIVDDKQEILMVNKQFEAMFGYDRSEVVGRNIAMLIPPRFGHHLEHHNEYMRNPHIKTMGQRKELYALHKDGSELPVEISLSPLATPDGLIVSAAIRDVTERKRYEEQLKYLATHDDLTGLPNRNLLVERLNLALLLAERHQREVALLFIDLDNFKDINDSLGHDRGDRLLQMVAMRLSTCIQASDTAGRQGGDDFVVILTDLMESESGAIAAQRIQQALTEPFEIEAQKLHISCSIGIAVFPKDGREAQVLLKNGELAMFRAKERERGTFHFLTEELNDRVVARLNMERCLRQALENDELSVHYQPQLDLVSGRMIGAEALVRWQSPELGMVSPAGFIPLAEQTGLIIPIGERVLTIACRQNSIWQNAGFAPLVMAVNLSPRQFWQPGLTRTVAKILQDSGLGPGYLELEIIESMVMREVASALAMLHDLKGLGVKLAIDDFGTGYSSLSQLKRFPFDKLKMDISFVREVTCDPGSAAIARTIIAMAHNLNLLVIAEGIETEGQLCYLRNHGCDEMQGFLFSRPLPAEDFERLLREDRRLDFPEEGAAHPEKTLLLVDDEPSMLKALDRVLNEQGYRILATTDARKGFELLATNRVGVILCDQRMPGMSGVEFLGKVKDLHPGVVRIAMSGYADMDMVTDAVNQGAIYKFLTKPFDNDLLRRTIKKAFERFEAVSGEKRP